MTLSHSYDIYGRTEPAIIYLAKPGKRLYRALNGIDTSTVNTRIRTNDTAELTFTMNKYVDGEILSEFDEVEEMMELWCDGIWFKIVDPPSVSNDGTQCTKEVTAESYEVGLTQYRLKNFNINNGESSAYNLVYKKKLDQEEAKKKYPDRADDQEFIESYDSGKYYTVRLYDPDCKELSFLDLVLQHADVPGWKVGTVDHLEDAKKATEKANAETDEVKKQELLNEAAKILPNKVCNFQVDDKSVFSFLTQEASTAYDCVFEFDTENMLVNVHDIADFGKDTDVVIGFRNIQNNVSMSRDDSMVTQFYVDGLDDYGIDQANYGSSILTDLSYFAREPYMDDGLAEKYKEWAAYRYDENNIKTYMELSKEYNKLNETLTELRGRVPVDTAENNWFESGIDDLITAYNDNVAIINGLKALYVDENNNFDFEALKASSDWSLYESVMNYTLPAIVAAIQSKEDADKNTAKEKLNLNNIGNGNLLSNVNPVVFNTYWIPDGINLADINTVQLDEYDENKTASSSPAYGITRGIKFVRKNPGTFGVIQKKVSITPDMKHTISCYVKSNGATTFQIGYRKNGDDSEFTTKNISVDQQGGWTIVSYTFTDSSHLIDVCFKSNGSCVICGMQLELGDTATQFGYFIQSEDTMKAYETDWKLYGIDELKVKISTYDNCMKTLEKNGLNKPYQTGSGYEEDYANQMYRTYDDYKTLKAQAEAALKERQAEYDAAKEPQNQIQAKRTNFSEAVEWVNYGKEYNSKYSGCNHNHIYSKFTEEELLILKTLTRQASYSNENIITTSLTTTESAVDKCKELYDDAVDELYAESHPQYEYTDEVENIYALPEFKEYHDKLNINDFVYLETDADEYVKLRVTEISYNPCDMDENMEITFMSPTTYKTKRNDFVKLLGAAINKASHDGGTVQGVNKVSDNSTYVINSDVIQRIFANPVFSAKTTSLTTGNSGDITANKIVTQLLNADEGTFKKLTADSAFIKELTSNGIRANKTYSIYDNDYDEYRDFVKYENGIIKIGLFNKDRMLAPLDKYFEFSPNTDPQNIDESIYVHGNLMLLDDFSGGLKCREISFEKITDEETKSVVRACYHDQIQTGEVIGSNALNITSTSIQPYTYRENGGWMNIGIYEYGLGSSTLSIGSSSNMFNSLYLAGGIQSLGTYNATTTSGGSVYVTSTGLLRRYVSSSSSMSLKNHIKEITYQDAKALLDSHVFSFRYNPEMYSLEDQVEAQKDRYGFILEDLERTFPMAVEHDENGLPTSWCLQVVVPTHLAITKEHEKKLSEHEIKINNSECKIEQLRSENKQLKLENEQIRTEIELLKKKCGD